MNSTDQLLAPTSSTPQTSPQQSVPVVPAQYVAPFILVTSLFALWGFANDLTNPLVKVFKEVFLISNAQSSLVQTAFYGGYATMAIPAALLIRRYSYKVGIIAGLSLYLTGALLFIPAAMMAEFWMFLAALYILTFGLAFLETTANPYILSMGPAETATQRLNLAQAFNPIGSLIGMLVASQFILTGLETAKFRDDQMQAHPEFAQMLPGEVEGRITASMVAFSEASPAEFQAMQRHDLGVVQVPYVAIAIVVGLVLLLFAIFPVPNTGQLVARTPLGEVVGKLLTFQYVGGVIAQAFYVGAQIMCWTFIIHYGMGIAGLSAAQAQHYNIAAMVLFLVSRFICTFILKYLKPGLLLGLLAIVAMVLTLGVIFLDGYSGLYCLVGISGCMSLMFPTIYGLALRGLSADDSKLASAGLIFAIVGGALLPRMQGQLIDMPPVLFAGVTLDSVQYSFVLPLVCFFVVAIYGLACVAMRPALARPL